MVNLWITSNIVQADDLDEARPDPLRAGGPIIVGMPNVHAKGLSLAAAVDVRPGRLMGMRVPTLSTRL
jgi:hypothetical protein